MKNMARWLQLILAAIAGLVVLLVIELSGTASSSAGRFFTGVLTGLSAAALLVAAYLYFSDEGPRHSHHGTGAR